MNKDPQLKSNKGLCSIQYGTCLKGKAHIPKCQMMPLTNSQPGCPIMLFLYLDFYLADDKEFILSPVKSFFG